MMLKSKQQRVCKLVENTNAKILEQWNDPNFSYYQLQLSFRELAFIIVVQIQVILHFLICIIIPFDSHKSVIFFIQLHCHTFLIFLCDNAWLSIPRRFGIQKFDFDTWVKLLHHTNKRNHVTMKQKKRSRIGLMIRTLLQIIIFHRTVLAK